METLHVEQHCKGVTNNDADRGRSVSNTAHISQLASHETSASHYNVANTQVLMSYVTFATHRSESREAHMLQMPESAFDPVTFLANAGLGRRIVKISPNNVFYSQGSLADHVYYL